ncbi:RNA-dependent DNA polymerase [Phytophthora cinnamomi]|uniref:RNA-dependent DNA polymerase n=1 Tax=Phytophthora cinnamomi TaxID=4785 RepID=UPI0035594626|nr:RNA-dependent DNA polymerase [Phytophthora cinnamomi]
MLHEALTVELYVCDKARGRVQVVTSQQQAHDEAKKNEAERQLDKGQKRLAHTKEHRERRAERERTGTDGEPLLTAVVKVQGEQRRFKLDTGAQYSVAGDERRQYAEKQHALPPVDYVEGFTGAVSRVLGVRRFKFRTQYEQTMEADALIVEGATEEFLLREDWMLRKGVKIDFISCVRGRDEEDRAVPVLKRQQAPRASSKSTTSADSATADVDLS